VVGTLRECLEKVEAIRDTGVAMFLITAIGPQPNEIIIWFGREVIPKLK